MNVEIIEDKKSKRIRIIIYSILLIICVVAVGIAIYQFFADEKLGVIVGITNSETNTEEYEKIKAEFDTIFGNNLNGTVSEQVHINKQEQDKDIVYTHYQKEENVANDYNINVNIPYINIDSDIIKKYNKEISDNFEAKAINTLNSTDKNTIYTVEYEATIENNILSLIIHSNLKEGNSAQRVLVQTYNYDLVNNKEITLQEMLQLKQIDKAEAQTKIRSSIQTEQQKAEELIKVGYQVYQRDYTSDIYSIEKSTEFFVYNNYLYIVYLRKREVYEKVKIYFLLYIIDFDLYNWRKY